MIETVTHLLFTTNQGIISDFMLEVYRNENHGLIGRVNRNIRTFSDLRLATLMSELKTGNIVVDPENMPQE